MINMFQFLNKSILSFIEKSFLIISVHKMYEIKDMQKSLRVWYSLYLYQVLIVKLQQRKQSYLWTQISSFRKVNLYVLILLLSSEWRPISKLKNSWMENDMYKICTHNGG